MWITFTLSKHLFICILHGHPFIMIINACGHSIWMFCVHVTLRFCILCYISVYSGIWEHLSSLVVHLFACEFVYWLILTLGIWFHSSTVCLLVLMFLPYLFIQNCMDYTWAEKAKSLHFQSLFPIQYVVLFFNKRDI